MSGPGPEEPVLPDTTSDERDGGWGDERSSGAPDGGDPDDLERFLRDVPPHHGD